MTPNTEKPAISKNGRLFTLDCAKEVDACEMAEVQVGAWRAAYGELFGELYVQKLNPDRLEAQLQKELLTGLKGAVLADGERWVFDWGCEEWVLSELVGMSTYRSAFDRPAGWAELVALYLLPEFRGEGLSRALLEYTLERMRSEGYRHCTLWVPIKNTRAQSFFEHLFFGTDGQQSTYSLDGLRVQGLRYEREL